MENIGKVYLMSILLCIISSPAFSGEFEFLVTCLRYCLGRTAIYLSTLDYCYYLLPLFSNHNRLRFDYNEPISKHYDYVPWRSI